MNRINEADAAARQIESNNALLDYVAAKLGARTDAHLAALLGSHPPVVSRIRNGKLAIGATLQILLIEMGFPLEVIRRYVPSTFHGTAQVVP